MVTVNYPIDLRLVADVTNSSLGEIVALNPSLLRMTTPRDISFDLHLPVGTEDVFSERIKQVPEDKRASWRFHVVRSGETLDGIASSLHAHSSEIAKANGLPADGGVDADDELVIPMAGAAPGAGPQRYSVRRGDTLVTVADRFGVSVEELRRWNHLSSNVVKPGSTLAVAAPVKLAPVTHVRSKSARGKKTSHVPATSIHAPSTHSKTGHSGTKTSSASSATNKKATTKTTKSR